MNASWIELQSADGRSIPAWQAVPQDAAQGGVVVLQEIFGVNAHIRAVVESYARAGYVGIAPALFERLRPGVDMGYDKHDIQVGKGLKTAAEKLPSLGVLQDIQAAVDQAAKISGGKVAVVGYCWGGLLAWRAASLVTGLSASVVYYGGGMTAEKELELQPQVPVQAHLSNRDASTPLAGIEALKALHPEVEVHLYSADHGFNCDQRAAYDKNSAELARTRVNQFLSRHLS